MNDWPLGYIMGCIRDWLGAVDATTIQAGTTPDPTAVLWYFGEKWRTANTRPPRYAWWPGDILPGPPHHGDEGGSNPSAATGEESVIVSCWGITPAAAWHLRRRLIFGAYAVGLADFKYLGDRVTRALSGDNDLGVEYLTRLSFSIPVVNEALAEAPIDDFDHQAIAIINGVEFVAATH